MEFLINLAFIVLLGLVGLIVGSALERKHYRSIREREAALKHILVFNEKRPPLTVSGQAFYMVQGSVVVSSDYFKNLAASLRRRLPQISAARVLELANGSLRLAVHHK